MPMHYWIISGNAGHKTDFENAVLLKSAVLLAPQITVMAPIPVMMDARQIMDALPAEERDRFMALNLIEFGTVKDKNTALQNVLQSFRDLRRLQHKKNKSRREIQVQMNLQRLHKKAERNYYYNIDRLLELFDLLPLRLFYDQQILHVFGDLPYLSQNRVEDMVELLPNIMQSCDVLLLLSHRMLHEYGPARDPSGNLVHFLELPIPEHLDSLQWEHIRDALQPAIGTLHEIMKMIRQELNCLEIEEKKIPECLKYLDSAVSRGRREPQERIDGEVFLQSISSHNTDPLRVSVGVTILTHQQILTILQKIGKMDRRTMMYLESKIYPICRPQCCCPVLAAEIKGTPQHAGKA